jgi:hypothetical protein
MVSLASLLAPWLGSDAPGPSHASPPVTASAAATDRACPASDSWLPGSGIAEVIAPHAAWLQRLRYAYGAEPHVFERDIGAVVERYAQCVHLLPATADRYFRGAGGLFRMGLQIGFYALQATDGAIFSGRETITRRAALEPRWRYATFLAGLCSELYRSLSDLTVSNERGDEWPAYLQPLSLWLLDTNSRRYQVRWLPNPESSRALAMVAMAHVVTPSIMQYLAEGNLVVPQLLASLCGTAPPGASNTLDELVRRSVALVIDQEQRAAGVPQGAPPAQPAFPSLESIAAQRVPPPRVALRAPEKLHPPLRAALQEIVATLDAPALPRAAAVMALGVFVPLHELARRGVDPASAVRALSDAHMLARDSSDPQSKTCTRAFAGERALGVVLAPHCVGGLAANVLDATVEGCGDRR